MDVFIWEQQAAIRVSYGASKSHNGNIDGHTHGDVIFSKRGNFFLYDPSKNGQNSTVAALFTP